MFQTTVFGKLCLVVAIFAVSTYGAEQQYQRVSRERHNVHRQRHQVGALSASDDLNNRAIRCAEYYAQKGGIDHSCPHKNGAGENLWAYWGPNQSDDWVAQSSTDGWYSEESRHDYNKDYQPGTGHFTQLVWKNSRSLGFGTGRKGNMIVAVALYSPHGNVIGQFRDNVFPPRR